MKITRDESTMMKGYAILCIALHNFLHHPSLFSFAKENENTFLLSRTTDFFDSLLPIDFSILGNLFSFLGWCGVPIFIFLSGYGLVKKHEFGSQGGGN